MLRRSAGLRRDTPKSLAWAAAPRKALVRRVGLRKASQRQIRRQATLLEATEALIEWTGGRCQAQIPWVCSGPGVVAHHRRRRSQGGSDDLSNLILLCDACHGHIHAEPAWAADAGYLLRTEAA